jgi:hypothetical protein
MSQTINKRQRTAWNKFEKVLLLEAFNEEPYLTPERLTFLAEKLGKPEAPVKTWFRNQRRNISAKRLKTAKTSAKITEIQTEIIINSEKSDSGSDLFDEAEIEPDLIFKFVPGLWESHIQQLQTEQAIFDNFISRSINHFVYYPGYPAYCFSPIPNFRM